MRPSRDFKTNSMNLLQILTDPALMESPSTLVPWRWIRHCLAVQAGPDGWLAAVGLQPLASAQPLGLSVCNFLILPQFSLKSTVIAFPHPHSSATHHTVRSLQHRLPWAESSTFTGPITLSTHTFTHTHRHACTQSLTRPLINFTMKQKQRDTHEEDVKRKNLKPGED